ncbi:hypothetical protein K458DRAFT_468506 [Lentithecium fluviatile CBS 122367]|uniref:Cora-domain-containing protein n=1 Tax=Lentithecium fluviatile CBS 122367 TaxID=1168545 RepID=A0A6G1IEH7_9PLEO|nr:hypothetical protein K458DRAFT_468506 [Lentithecium fluviatile CBS 122367]
MLRVIRSWVISGMFLDVLQKFGDQPQIFQESSGARQSFVENDGSFELCYQFMYVQLNGKCAPRDPWSFRQTGVYHRYSARDHCNRVALLHPSDEALSQSRLDDYAQSSCRIALATHPLNVHLVVLSSYLISWQDHIESLASELEQIIPDCSQRRHIDVVDTSAPHATPLIDPDRLQTLRHIEYKIVCKACRCLRSTITIVQTLMTVNSAVANINPHLGQESQSIYMELQQFEQRLECHINAAEILAQRVQATLGLLTNLLDVENQAISNKINTRILRLTRDSVDDNATVRVITVCTLIYLPASFMASFLGMNLFDFGVDDGAFRTSPNFGYTLWRLYP